MSLTSSLKLLLLLVVLACPVAVNYLHDSLTAGQSLRRANHPFLVMTALVVGAAIGLVRKCKEELCMYVTVDGIVFLHLPGQRSTEKVGDVGRSGAPVACLVL